MDQQISENIKALRKQHRLTQKEMAAQLNIAERSYQRIENGEQKGINLLMLQRICWIFSITLNELLN